MRYLTATSMAVLLAAPVALAQEQGSVRLNEKQAAENQAIATARLKEELAARVPLEPAVKGAPYSADVVVESNQTLGDGNHISNKSVGHVYRDSEGRTRREQEGAFLSVTRTEPVILNKGMTISIVDPVGGYSYSLNPEQKIAWRTPIGASKKLLDEIQVAGQRSSQPMTDEQKARMADELKKQKAAAEKEAAARERAAQSTDAPSKTSSEVIARAGGRGGWSGYAFTAPGPLEHKTIDGLAVEGHQRTETIPAGQIGNDLPITVTSEEWTSTDLKVLVLTKHNDPRTGESTYRLTNVVRAEPDPSLFMVPPDYQVKDTGIRRNNE